MTADHFSIRVVVAALAVGTLGGLLVMAALALLGEAIPDQLDRLVTLLAGGLIGVLAKTTTGTEAVQVVNPDSDPVPVAPADPGGAP